MKSTDRTEEFRRREDVRAADSLRAGRKWFEEWRDVEEFARVLGGRPPRHRSNEFKYWREGWIGSRIVRWEHPRASLRLTPDSANWGDIEVRDGDSQFCYEIAEAVDAKSLAAFNKGAKSVEVSEEELSGDMTREWIPRLVSMKAAKGYPPGTGLIIYLDLWDDHDDLGREELPGLVPETHHGFRSIWILNSGGRGAWQIFPTLRVVGTVEQLESLND